jgi:hypothetical protein
MLSASKSPTSAMGRLTLDSYFPVPFTHGNFRERKASIPMIRRAGVDAASAVELLEQDNQGELVLKG